MAKYIDKSALVAEIERIKKEECPIDTYEGRCKLLWFEQFLSSINTLEVKEVEEETISEDLEYAALLHYPKMSRISEPHGFIPADNKSHYLGDANEDNRKAFIVGAQWQKEQDAIEVKEVDLDKIVDDWYNTKASKEFENVLYSDIENCAKYFFELGLMHRKDNLYGNKY